MPNRTALAAERTQGAWFVLCDEDDVAARRLEKGLHQLGHKVHVFHAIEAALEFLKANDGAPWVVLSDRLPGAKRTKGVAAVRAIAEDTPLVLMIDGKEESLLFEGYSAGCDLVLTRPVQAVELDAIAKRF